MYKCSSKKNEKKERRKIEPIDWIRIWIQSFVCPLIEFNQLNYPGHQPFLFFSPNLKIWNGKRWYVYEIETEIKNEKRFDSSIFIIESYFFIIIIIIIILFSVDQIKFFPTCRNIYDFEVRKRRYIYTCCLLKENNVYLMLLFQNKISLDGKIFVERMNASFSNNFSTQV